MIDVLITSKPLDPQSALIQCVAPNSGGTVIFLGTVRDSTKGREVIALEFETYESMALREMERIAEQIRTKWKANSVLIHHRIGRLEIGEAPVLIIVSCPHRKEAFLACEWAIDELKRSVPIWKKEIFLDGEIWISAHP
ncbi:MAG: molybdenum cofactor biosynthesis protein MoaE [Flavobacteriales bacterium]|nr:molybdenum cofactor biosynthesis protein MoaE [Flavobacteriales bacterium]